MGKIYHKNLQNETANFIKAIRMDMLKQEENVITKNNISTKW